MTTKRTRLKAAAIALAAAATFSSRPGASEGAVLYALQVLPAGPASQPADGRPTLLHDNAALAAEFNAKGRRAVLDVGHLSEYTETVAAGWVTELFVAEDGALWAWVDLTAAGQPLIDGKLFGFTSPTLRVRETEAGWQVVGFKSLALTNNPALDTMSANFSEEADADAEDEGPDATEASTAEQAAEATETVQEPTNADAGTDTPAEGNEAEQTAALTATAPAAETVALAEFAAVQASVVSLTAERDGLAAQVASFTAQLATLTAERDTARADLAAFAAADMQRQVTEAVDAHISAGKGTPAQREQLLGFAAKDLAGFRTFSASSPKLGVFGRLAVPDSEDGKPHVPAEVQEYLSKHGLPVEAYQRGLS